MIDKSTKILAYLKKKLWLSGDLTCDYLAAGEYNENYLITAGEKRYVFRINHNTQLALDNQIEYEYQVLEALRFSEVTPLPYFYDLEAEDLGKGVLLMEYLPGRALDYSRDLPAAAQIFARIHHQPTDNRLILQGNPARDIASESLRLLHCYDGPHYSKVRSRLLTYHSEIVKISEEMSAIYANEDYCIVNTEVNSGNFLIDETRASLVDWEKAVVSYRYQDLAHFLVPTTTLWKTEFRFSEENKRHFLNLYIDAGDLGITIDEVYQKTQLMERVILLRAFSWCYMAYHEYTSADRELNHNDTFATITSYLDNAECFLK